VLNAKPRLKKKQDEDAPGAPAWMLTFGDMMTLLLTFFVLLVSMSVIREEEFEAAKKSIQQVFLHGYWRPTRTPIPSEKDRIESERRSPEPGRTGEDVPEEIAALHIKQQIDSRLDQVGLGGLVTAYVSMREVRIRIPDQILFGVDSAELKDLHAYEVLHGIAQVLAEMDYCVSIEGHTADRDIVGEQFEDLWQLSTARALAVLRYFEANDIAPERLSAVGYGATRPVADNDTFRNRALNRRVELVVRDMTPKDFQKRSDEDPGR